MLQWIRKFLPDLTTWVLSRVSAHPLKVDITNIPSYDYTKCKIRVLLSTNVVIRTEDGFFRPIRRHEKLPQFIESTFLLAKDVLDDVSEVNSLEKEYERRRNELRTCRAAKSFFQNKRDNKAALFVYASLLDWQHNPGDGYHSFSANRILCTDTVARAFGLGNMFPIVRLCKITVDEGREWIGTMMDYAEGIYPLNLKEGLKDAISTETQKILVNLHVLDAVCYEKDHKPGNYNIVTDGGFITNISVFDNDCPWTFFPSFSPNFKNYDKSSTIIKNGQMNAPCIDERFVERILGIEAEEMKGALQPYLNRIQIAALLSRVKKIKKAILKSIENDECFVIQTGEEWPKATVMEEIQSDRWGNSYLKILYNRWEFIKENYPWVLKNHNLI